MSIQGDAKRNQDFLLPPDVKPWEVVIEKTTKGETILRTLTPAQADFAEELMWQDHR